jgi:hypothetical protein
MRLDVCARVGDGPTLAFYQWRPMSLHDVISGLRQEEERLGAQLSKIRAAITALGSNIVYVATGRGGPKRRGPGRPRAASVRKRRTLSAKARAAISAAQKKRWAKVRAAKKRVSA